MRFHSDVWCSAATYHTYIDTTATTEILYRVYLKITVKKTRILVLYSMISVAVDRALG